MNFLKKYAIFFLPIISLVSYSIATQYDWYQHYGLPPELFWVEVLFALSSVTFIAFYVLLFQKIWTACYRIQDKDFVVYGILSFLVGFTGTLVFAFLLNGLSLVHFSITWPGMMGAMSSTDHYRFFGYFGTVGILGLVVGGIAALLGAIIGGISRKKDK